MARAAADGLRRGGRRSDARGGRRGRQDGDRPHPFEDEPDPALPNNPRAWLSTAGGGTPGLGHRSARTPWKWCPAATTSPGSAWAFSYFPGTATKQLDLIRAYADKVLFLEA
ncbi:hypothetical protein AB0A71_05390 [Kitasatospora aureofaciens]|uniref:hypothetical protein n=1 Tax=Kitasatospora aureofaciens TaxID=1894 RepID=UPI00340A9859